LFLELPVRRMEDETDDGDQAFHLIS
jgi:hypothetical protein